MPTVGYVVEEAAKEGRLNVEAVMPLLERNREAIREQWGVRDPRALLKRVKLLGQGAELSQTSRHISGRISAKSRLYHTSATSQPYLGHI